MKCQECGLCDHLASTEGDICPRRERNDETAYAKKRERKAIINWIYKNKYYGTFGGCKGSAVIAEDLLAWLRKRGKE